MLEMTAQRLDWFAYTNAALLTRPARAVALDFHGLGYGGLKTEPGRLDMALADAGVLCVFPYYGAQSWMNREAVRYVDRVLALVRERYALPDTLPVISSGGSMGGLAALVYTRYAARTPAACAANCPVCDLVYHATERPDLPATIYAAFAHYDCGLDRAVEQTSPLHLVPEMPDIPYLLIHGTADAAVNKQRHSDRFVAAMRQAGRQVEYLEAPGMAHCDFTGHPEAEAAYRQFIARQ